MTVKKFYFQENQNDIIPKNSNDDGVEPILFNESIWLKSRLHEQFRSLSLSITTKDLLNLALLVYTIDQTLSRNANGYLGWSRHIQISLPVSNCEKWNHVKHQLETLLSFLSGDKWEIEFREKVSVDETIYEPSNPKNITKVSLFSGGLDSLIGVIDLIEKGEKVALVSHYKNGSSEHKAQQKLYGLLNQDKIMPHQFYVQPNQNHFEASKENSSRARSFLFIALGIAVSNSLGDLPLIIPENGLISLNVPLIYTRLGSHSTRTTHPYYLHLINQVLAQLNFNIVLENPYLHFTKGEMIENCKNQALLSEVFKYSISCSHPDISRFSKKSPGQHCGYCVPCLIRRAALVRVGLKDDFYLIDVKTDPPISNQKSGSDYLSFKLALKRLEDVKPNHIPLYISSAGSLSFLGGASMQSLSEMYVRGMNEVKKLIE